ncbi:hypothetical protein C7I87_02380 [Mesorhizobium sp. SARCC-RB16n]|nr:hypothetical protein C7I87_02380 [Mesorhizobium sp. SARCC-RB16n]
MGRLEMMRRMLAGRRSRCRDRRKLRGACRDRCGVGIDDLGDGVEYFLAVTWGGASDAGGYSCLNSGGVRRDVSGLSGGRGVQTVPKLWGSFEQRIQQLVSVLEHPFQFLVGAHLGSLRDRGVTQGERLLVRSSDKGKRPRAGAVGGPSHRPE